MKIQLTVKEIADIVGMPPRRIRYYHQIGLFAPSGVDPQNGYHYYTLEKIEELRLIMYLRHLNVPIAEIKQHLNNRNLSDYSRILERQLHQTRETISALTVLASRLEKRMQSIAYIHHLPAIGNITLLELPPRDVLTIRRSINEPLDWEIAMLDFEREADLPPSLFIGDIGFFVDLRIVDHRHATQFTGLYLFADDAYFGETPMRETLPGGSWLTVVFRGDHQSAPEQLKAISAYAEANHLLLADYALERVLIDHFIASDPNLYLTEIQIYILGSS
ncbi:MerR family transcriptional regulator [Fusibacter paucivorans]|uniref:MerR family transcriptional regulator n=1 Tax=Fusibacter paucivorans TaxID=76009 RepID=A0ABS5PPJ8_9FIRM|nr:MerR family transcriptional regulator [Fusibacter paucivorans]MBS7525947.1 MerR family transcriptional regulator [Fusibacter paucivorans]